MTKPNRTAVFREQGLRKLQQDMRTVAESASPVSLTKTHPGIIALRRALKAMHWDRQGGYSSYLGDGKWSFASSGIGQFSPDEMNALFNLVGVVPDVIKSKGHCEDCKHARPITRGAFVIYQEQGYTGPCSPCERPKMSNFEPRKKFPKNRGFWCFQCGHVSPTRHGRDAHAALREASPSKDCP